MVVAITLLLAGCEAAYVPDRVKPYAELEPEIITYTVNVDTVTGGTIGISPQKDAYLPNEYIKLTASPAEGYTFIKWSGTFAVTENPYVFQIEKDEWIIPVFTKDAEPPAEDRYTVKIDAANGGTFSKDPANQADYGPNDQIKVTASPNSGYEFIGWTGTMDSIENPLVFPVTANHWIIAQFRKTGEQETYTVKFDAAVSGGTAVLSPAKISYLPNDIVRLTATASEGYEFTGWIGTINSTQNPFVFKVTDNQWIIPVFHKDADPPAPVTYTLKVDKTGGGAAAIDPAKDRYTENETVKISAEAYPGFTFTGWTGTVNSTQNPLILKMTSDGWIVPEFRQIPTYNLLTEWNPIGGSVSSSTGGKTSFLYGEKCNLTATAKAGYTFDGWEGDIESAGDTIYITFDRDYQVNPRFSIIVTPTKYTLTVPSSVPNGSITLAPNKAEYNDNEIVRVTAVPDPEYMFSSWSMGYSSKPETVDIVMNSNKSVSPPVFIRRKWTFVVYMAADNDLEPSAIADFNELEGIRLAGQPVSILVLLDRSPFYDNSNGDWTDTRLYEITKDPNGINGTIVSRRLAWSDMGLTATGTSNTEELNMADPNTLKWLLEYAQRDYQAENYGLIVWGHGTGWKGSGDVGGHMPEPMKAVAVDDSFGPNANMNLQEFGTAIHGKGLKVIGFDTCFGALLEVAYQIKGDAEYLVASEGVIPSYGWDYTSLFDTFLATDLSASKFCDAAISQFQNQYSGTPNATISKIDLSKIGTLFSRFEEFAHALADQLDSANTTDVRAAILTGSTIGRYSAETPETDLYIDMYSFSEEMASTLSVDASALQTALYNAVPASWAQKNTRGYGDIGIYVVGLNNGVPKTSHDSGYVSGSASLEKSAFVTASNHWVPNMNPALSTRFLDKLFYFGY